MSILDNYLFGSSMESEVSTVNGDADRSVTNELAAEEAKITSTKKAGQTMSTDDL